MSRILVVGAGFAGAVYARKLAEAGYDVDVIDKRDHIAGNCYDYVHENGVTIHKYGPHLFHTSNLQVVEWLSNFTEWLPYEHEVVASLPDGRFVPVPVNLDTVNAVFHTNLTDKAEIANFLQSRAVERDPILNAEDHLFSTIGPELTDLFFRPYTKKMWGMDLSETDAAVVRRLQIRPDRDRRYFPNDSFQALPANGYTALFARIFDHEKINVHLGKNFSRDMVGSYGHCFNSMPIDEYYNFELGELPYRSIRFHLTEQPRDLAASHSVINYTHAEPHTRETWWHNFPGHDNVQNSHVLRTIEEPCDYKDNYLERYYPVKTADGRYDRLYEQYAERAALERSVSFIGRCGTYQYLDMHQVINQSMIHVTKWIDRAAP